MRNYTMYIVYDTTGNENTITSPFQCRQRELMDRETDAYLDF